MTQPLLIERITRSLAYMLRHQPEKFDVEVDAFGFADVEEVIRALNERLGEPVVLEDLELAVHSGDRARYEIHHGRIRALYGHSIPVEPGDSTRPPEVLYVAIPARDLDRAQRFGLRGGRRRFVHLALSESDARESGRRAAEEYTILTIQALEAWEEGIGFFDRQSLYLAEEIPTHLIRIGGTYSDGNPPLRGRAPERDGGRRPDRGRGRGDDGRRPRRSASRGEEARGGDGAARRRQGGRSSAPPARVDGNAAVSLAEDRAPRRSRQSREERPSSPERAVEPPAAVRNEAPSTGFGAGLSESPPPTVKPPDDRPVRSVPTPAAAPPPPVEEEETPFGTGI